MKKSLLFLVLIIMVAFFSCKKETVGPAETKSSFTETESLVADADGNIYHKITIGNQVWMLENLRTTHYRNGDMIENVKYKTAWNSQTGGAYCSLNNDDQNTGAYGLLYNWYAVKDKRNITPPGWHVPTREELWELTQYLGGQLVAAGKLKESGAIHWGNLNTSTNLSGFTALPAGYRSGGGGEFLEINTLGLWWTSDAMGADQNLGACYYMNASSSNLWENGLYKSSGLSIRCIKDR
jgi:uncharacterized protein (TIGR02145 family)